jgi:hypothetical protein
MVEQKIEREKKGLWEWTVGKGICILRYWRY